MSVEILYHDNCADGFGAAYAAWKYFVDELELECVHFHRVQYGQPVPDLPSGAMVYILDFSYEAETLETLHAISKSLQVIDHHRSAEVALAGLPYAIFDMEKSGAVMAWEFFFPDRPVPKLLQYVQDRDLWRLELPGSRDFSMGLRGLVDFDFAMWDQLATDEMAFQDVMNEGAILREYMNREIERKVHKAGFWDLDGHRVPVLNESLWISETCEALLERYPEAPCGATFFLNKRGEIIVSLRSRSDRNFDVSQLASRRGGGGHVLSAGFHHEGELNFIS